MPFKQMLPKKNRLSLKTRLDNLQKKGTLAQNPLFGLLYLKNDTQAVSFAFIVSNKVARLATERNRIRRLLSEAVRLESDQIKPGIEAVFLIKKAIIGHSFDLIQKEVQNIFTQAKLYSNENNSIAA